MSLAWVAFNLSTGAAVADLPTLAPQWPLPRTLCKYETATADLFLDGAPGNWQQATRQGYALLACYDEEDPAEVFQWSGYVSQRDRSTDLDSATLSLVTAEGYADRRFVGNRVYTNEDQGAILTDLVDSFAASTPSRPGLPITVALGDTGGLTRSFKFNDTDNGTLYAALQQLAALLNGLEWLIDWHWNASHDGVEAVLRAATRLGVSPPAGQMPAAAFELGSGGNLISASLTESYADQQGANVVRTYATGAGSSAPTSGDYTVADWQGRPAFELRYSPVQSTADVPTLQSYAQKALAQVGPGYAALSLKAAFSESTRHGGLWLLGDDLSYNVDPCPPFPDGYAGVARSIGYQISEQESDSSITPVVAVPVLPSDGSSGSTVTA